jgi:hypothetical protein
VAGRGERLEVEELERHLGGMSESCASMGSNRDAASTADLARHVDFAVPAGVSDAVPVAATVKAWPAVRLVAVVSLLCGVFPVSVGRKPRV